MVKSLAVVGAGAKAAAIAARRSALQQLVGPGRVPDLFVFERDHVAAAWTGSGGFSSGHLTLCTPGEKDIGYPYPNLTAWAGAPLRVDKPLFGQFSWNAWLADTGRLQEWVERGRDHPLHSEWGDYLEWAFDTAGQAIIYEEVTAIKPLPLGRWEIAFGEDEETLEVDGVVLTGAGRSRLVPTTGDIPPDRIFTAEDFWKGRETILERSSPVVAVAGSGGSAATIVAWLAQRLAETPAQIHSITPSGTLFPRGDGYAERRWYSDPSEWRSLTREHRRQIVDRTEAGVVSMRVKSIIDRAQNVQLERGRADLIKWDSPASELKVKIRYGRKSDDLPADIFVNAIGFDSLSSLKLIKHLKVEQMVARGRMPADILFGIKENLSLPEGKGFPPNLHVPGLAALARGPGMSNLGCLGLVARAVLDGYLI